MLWSIMSLEQPVRSLLRNAQKTLSRGFSVQKVCWLTISAEAKQGAKGRIKWARNSTPSEPPDLKARVRLPSVPHVSSSE